MRRALVTGGAGFIGSFLCDELVSRGYEVLAIDNLSRGRAENLIDAKISERCSLEILDLCSDGAIQALTGLMTDFRPDVIFHLAAINGTKYFYDRPLTVLSDNSRMSEVVCEAAIGSGFEGTIVFTSSSEVYGDPVQIPTSESAPVVVRPEFDRDSYALSKVAGEMMVRMSSEKYGWTYSILRLFNSYGPRMDSSEYGQVVPEFIRKSRSDGAFEMLGSGLQTRSFCYVEDTAYMIAEAADSFGDRTVNVGTSAEITISELAQQIHRLVGRDAEIVHLPASAGDHDRRCPDVSLQNRLAPGREFVSLEAGLLKCLDWYSQPE